MAATASISISQPGRISRDTTRNVLAGGILDIDVAIANRAQLRHGGRIQLGDDVIIKLDDIRHGATGGLDGKFEIVKDLLGLRFEVALAD
jgi:hypothetical protein